MNLIAFLVVPLKKTVGVTVRRTVPTHAIDISECANLIITDLLTGGTIGSDNDFTKLESIMLAVAPVSAKQKYKHPSTSSWIWLRVGTMTEAGRERSNTLI